MFPVASKSNSAELDLAGWGCGSDGVGPFPSSGPATQQRPALSCIAEFLTSDLPSSRAFGAARHGVGC